jgi:hypothetical protein
MKTIEEYLADIHLTLVESALVRNYTIFRQRLTSQSGYIRVRIDLVNGDFLEATEYFRLTTDDIQIVDYRHQWMDENRTKLINRWDSTPHHPELENFLIIPMIWMNEMSARGTQ